MKRAVFICLLCLGGLLLSTGIKAQTQQQEKASRTENIDKKATKLLLTVEGMSCQAGCADSIDHMLSKKEGIIKNKTTYATGTSVIWYDEKMISEKKITELIKERGFKAVVKKDDDPKENP